MHTRDISRAILTHRHQVVQAVITCQQRQQPDLSQRYDARDQRKTIEDTHHHLTYLSEAVAVDRPTLFADYMGWLRSVLGGYGVPEEDLRTNLDCLAAALQTHLPTAAHPIVEQYIQSARAQFEQPDHAQVSLLDPEAPYADLAQSYLNALMNGDRHRASRLILDAVEGGGSVRAMYMHVFQPVQHEVGRLWQINKISVAHEHFVTAATQLVMSQLYPRIFTIDKSGNTLVATCVGGELHEIGIRMVADFFEMDGWDTFYLGANTPVESIVQTLIERHADVLAISATMLLHISEVEKLVAAVRQSAARHTRILVGGYPFNVAHDLWQQIGADGYAQDADTAIQLANELVGKAD